MRKSFCYINGKIAQSDKIFVSGYDIGLLRGYSIYEGITTRGNKVFHLVDHLARLRRSAKSLGLQVPFSDKKIKNILETLIQKNGFRRTNFRIILSGGNTINGIEFNQKNPTFFILSEEWASLPAAQYQKGGKLITEEYTRFMPEIKTTNYITAVRLQPKRKKEKAIEILFVSNGKVLECSTSNIFMFNKNTLITPKENVLLGITRKAVLDIAKKNFKIEERSVTLSELLKGDEIFITASFKDVMPITQVDSRRIGNGKIGDNTKKIMRLFSELTKKS